MELIVVVVVLIVALAAVIAVRAAVDTVVSVAGEQLAVLLRPLPLHRADELVHSRQLAPHRIEAIPDCTAMEGELTRARFRSRAELFAGD